MSPKIQKIVSALTSAGFTSMYVPAKSKAVEDDMILVTDTIAIQIGRYYMSVVATKKLSASNSELTFYPDTRSVNDLINDVRTAIDKN